MNITIDNRDQSCYDVDVNTFIQSIDKIKDYAKFTADETKHLFSITDDLKVQSYCTYLDNLISAYFDALLEYFKRSNTTTDSSCIHLGKIFYEPLSTENSLKKQIVAVVNYENEEHSNNALEQLSRKYKSLIMLGLIAVDAQSVFAVLDLLQAEIKLACGSSWSDLVVFSNFRSLFMDMREIINKE